MHMYKYFEAADNLLLNSIECYLWKLDFSIKPLYSIITYDINSIDNFSKFIKTHYMEILHYSPKLQTVTHL